MAGNSSVKVSHLLPLSDWAELLPSLLLLLQPKQKLRHPGHASYGVRKATDCGGNSCCHSWSRIGKATKTCLVSKKISQRHWEGVFMCDWTPSLGPRNQSEFMNMHRVINYHSPTSHIEEVEPSDNHYPPFGCLHIHIRPQTLRHFSHFNRDNMKSAQRTHTMITFHTQQFSLLVRQMVTTGLLQFHNWPESYKSSETLPLEFYKRIRPQTQRRNRSPHRVVQHGVRETF